MFLNKPLHIPFTISVNPLFFRGLIFALDGAQGSQSASGCGLNDAQAGRWNGLGDLGWASMSLEDLTQGP